jgi:alpha-glucosidase
MVWENSNQNGGFSEAKPWLPVSSTHLKDNVAAQTDKPDAMLHHYKAAIALRHAFPALAIGSHHDLGNTGEILHFTRKHGDETIFCAFNLSDAPATITLPAGTWTQIGSELRSADIPGTKVTLAPWQPCLAQRIS